MRRFSVEKISDQKRLVRGEQLWLALKKLRARDEIHNREWRVLMMAGAAPRGEVTAIREVMPRAHIVAVDRDQSCVDAALAAGVDESVYCDLTDWSGQVSSRSFLPAAAIAERGRFDLICLDLCGGVNAETRAIFRAYLRLLTPRGVSIMTFSYGRDVVEVFNEMIDRYPYAIEALVSKGVPENLAGRLAYLFSQNMLAQACSIIAYRGNETPMCSVCYCPSWVHRSATYIRIEPGDFELAVMFPDPARLYDCPADRILALRRRGAALRASITRAKRTTATRKRSAASAIQTRGLDVAPMLLDMD